ncbi:MAG: hypothetical protein K0R65_1077 [Crocinitomicaceae bacterium]|jgi:hypothetical protein|nr:hypothetical protein [Crocinitomicaceae bacterium]
MKKTTLFIAALALSLSASAQFAFSVSPGLQLSGTQFGYKVQKFVPYIGIQMFMAKGEMIDKGTQNDPETGEIESFEDTYSAKISMILPTIGLKYFFLESNKLKAYANANFSKLILGGKIEDSTDPLNEADDMFQDIVKNTKVSAFQVGFGTEYFFDNNFSLGGEFGLNMVSFKSENEYQAIVTDPVTFEDYEVTNKNLFSAKFNPTYAKISLNFYFGKE